MSDHCPRSYWSRALVVVVCYAVALQAFLAAFGIALAISPASSAHIDYMLSKIPLGRLGEPQEIAALVAWLASEECSFSTGAVFDLSGGRSTY